MRRAVLGLALTPFLALSAFSPFQEEERNVREGNERLASGDPAEALHRYQAAEERAGTHPEIEFDRGDALYRLGRAAEAAEAWQRAREKGPGPLASRASQNAGTALAAGGDREGAIAAFTEALRKDPTNEDARFDLEVLLRRKQAQEKDEEQQRKAAEPRNQADAGAGAQPKPGQGPDDRAGQARQPQPGAAGRPPQASQDRQDPGPAAGAPQATPRDERAEGSRPGGPVSPQEAARILDAFRAREQAMPPPGADRRRATVANGDRDW
jgi:Ca-activated chloride channel family protein